MSLRESCGVFGVDAGSREAFPYLYWGMLAQNHRGHQSHGFATYKDQITIRSGLGLIPALTEMGIKKRIETLKGGVGIANVRYSTSGSQEAGALRMNAMPILRADGDHALAISFNGNVVNVRGLQELAGVDSGLSDAHALCKFMLDAMSEEGSVEEAVRRCMEAVDGAFSITGMTGDGTLFAFKDPVGIKPLCYGCSDTAKAFSSESVGLDINGIDHKREMRPGEFMKIEDGRAVIEQLSPCRHKAFCAFEFAYFARPDTMFDGAYVYQARRDFGVNLARRFSDVASRCEAVLSLPETANDAAYGFHAESGLPWEMATRRHRYVTQRAFITCEEERERVILRKVNLLKPLVKGRRLAVIDDSIVRGDTTRLTVGRLRAAGAEEINLFITYPPIRGPCFYGVDMATFGELLAARLEPDEIAANLGADTVNYQTIEDFVRATGMPREHLCLGCVTGEYPTPLTNQIARRIREQISRGEPEKGRIYEAP